MPVTILKNNKDLVGLLVKQLGSGAVREHLVLVSTPQDKRLLQAELSKWCGGIIPKVEVITHQLATWLKFGVKFDKDTIFLTPRERRFALSRWNTEFGFGKSDVQLDRLNDVIRWVLKHGESADKLPDSFGDLGVDIRHFESWCNRQGCIDRASLFQWAEGVPANAIDFKYIHLYQLGKMDRQHAVALDAIIENGGIDRGWYIYRPQGPSMGTGLSADVSVPAEQSDVRATAQVIKATHPRAEVEQIFQAIKRMVADSSGELSFDHFVLILSQYERYRPIVEHMSDRFDVGVSFSMGAKLIGDPAVSRLRTWLYLGLNGYALDDLLQVFGDGVIPLAHTNDDDWISPNLRTFSRFCKKYNIRTAEQLNNELDRAIVREVRNRNDTIRRRGGDPDLEPTDFEERHGTFYRSLRDSIMQLQSDYMAGTQPLSRWFSWVSDRIESLGTLKSAELMAGLERLAQAAQTGLAMVSRVGFDPPTDGGTFIETFDALLDGSLPVTQHPGRILVGQANGLSCLSGKKVFILGMTDTGFPESADSEDLFTSLDDDTLRWVRSREHDPLETAAAWLAHVSGSSDELSFCYSSDEATDLSMPSVFVTDPQIFLPWLDVESHQPAEDGRCFDKLDWMLRHRKASWDPAVDKIDEPDLANLSRHVASVARLRESPDKISVWDGVLSEVETEWSSTAHRVFAEALTNLKKDGMMRLSVSQLDDFAQSPLEYFFRRVLHLKPPLEYIDEAEMNQKGTLLHLILDRFYSETARYGELVDPKLDADKARIRISKIAVDVFAEHPEDLGNPDTPFPNLLKKQILKTLDGFIEAEHTGLKQIDDTVSDTVRPASLHNSEAKVTEVPFEFSMDVDGEQVLVSGFIDRIDSSADGSMKVIYDYKTGGDASIKIFDQMNAGLSFQLPVYLSATKKDSGSILAGYYHIQLSKVGKDIQLKGMLGDVGLTSIKPAQLKHKNNKGLKDRDALQMFLTKLQEERIKPIVRLLKSGRFHQSLTEPSEYSDYARMSRWSASVNELRKLTLVQGQDIQSVLGRYYVEAPILAGEDGSSDDGGED